MSALKCFVVGYLAAVLTVCVFLWWASRMHAAAQEAVEAHYTGGTYDDQHGCER